MDIEKLLRELAAERPVFHSEADFQHALAWHIHQRHSDSRIRLEFKPPWLSKRAYIDIWASQGSSELVLELKYKTRRIAVRLNGERFDLLNQSAQDIGRYDFLKDIERLEQVTSGNSGVVGLALMLTNDSSYWKPPKRADTVDASFRLHEERAVNGKLTWGRSASAGTTKGRSDPINISGEYTLQWKNYSTVESEAAYGKFRYLLVQVKSGSGS